MTQNTQHNNYSERAAGILAILSDRPVAYHPRLATVLGVKETVFVCQFLYWHGKGKLPDDWIYKAQQDITEETGLSRYEQETVRKRLKERGILEERLCGIPATLHYRLVTDKLLEIIEQAYPDREAEIPAPSSRHSPEQVWGNPPNKNGTDAQTEPGEIPQTQPGGIPQSIPENTIDDANENTSETTSNCAATAPRPPETPAADNEPIPENDPEQPLPPGADLDTLPPDQRRRALELASGLAATRHAEATGGTAARIADPNEPGSSPGGNRNGHNSRAPDWAPKVYQSLTRRSNLDGLDPEHIIALFQRFEERSGILVPGDPSTIRGWAAGARDCVAPWREYLERAGHGGDLGLAVRFAGWAMDVIFAQKASGRITWDVYSPRSLIKASRTLTADCRRLQQAQNLPPHRPPAWEEGQGSTRDWAQSDDPAVRAVLEQERWYQNRDARTQQAQATPRKEKQ